MLTHLKGFHLLLTDVKERANSSNVLVSFVATWFLRKSEPISRKISSSLFTMWIVTGRDEKRTIVLIRVSICRSNTFFCKQNRSLK